MALMRALIAARKSTKIQGGQEGHSLHTQDDHARDFCERMGWEVIGAARDTISGRVAPIDRKDLGKWLAEPHRFDVIVAYRTDRLSRGEQEDWTRIESWATEHRKVLCIVDSGTGIRYPARDDSDYWQWTATKREAGREWESARERSIRAQKALVASGSVTTSAPYGYRISGDKYKKAFEPIPEEAAIVRELFRRVTDGESLSRAAAWFAEATGRKVGVTRIHGMILNPAYAGRLERNGQQFGDCPPIVSMGEWTQAQKAMRSRKKKDKGGRNPKYEEALMSMICGECGSRMYRSGGPPAGRGQAKYYCQGKHGFGVPVAKADAAVLKALASSTEDEMSVEVIKGKDYADEIEAARRDRRQALERDDIEEVLRLTEVLKDFEARPAEPDRAEPKPTGRTVGQKFEAMTRDEVRAELRKGWTVVAWPDGRLRVISPWGRLES